MTKANELGKEAEVCRFDLSSLDGRLHRFGSGRKAGRPQTIAYQSLSSEALQDLLGCMPNVSTMQVAGIHWNILYPALLSATCRTCIQELHLMCTVFPPTTLPTLLLSLSLPILGILNLEEFPHETFLDDNNRDSSHDFAIDQMADILLTASINHTPLERAPITNLRIDRLAFQSFLHSTWSVSKAAKELSICDHRLRVLHLLLPMHYLDMVANSMSQALPHVVDLELRISTEGGRHSID